MPDEFELADFETNKQARSVVDLALFHLFTFLLNPFTLKEGGATSVPRCHAQRRGQLQLAIPLLPAAKA